MYSLFVVDDQVWTIKYFEKINWVKRDMEIAGVALNGKEAYEKICENPPDILVTDIKMPIMDGLELCKKISEEFPAVRTVILSAYGEFELAQTAIKYGVKHYILKPIEKDQLFQILDELKQDIEHEKEKSQQTYALKEKVESILSIAKERILCDILYGTLRGEQKIAQQLKDFQIDLDLKNLYCIILQLDNVNKRLEEAKIIVQEELQKYHSGYVCVDISANLVCIGNLYSEHDILKVERLAKSIQEQLENRLECHAVVGIGSQKISIINLYYSYKEGLQALKNRFYDEEQSIYFIDDVKRNKHELYVCGKEAEEIFQAIKLDQFSEAYSILDKLYEKIKQDQIDITDAVYEMWSIIKTVLRYVTEIGKEPEEVFQNKINIYKAVHEDQTLDEIYKNTKVIIHLVEEYISENVGSTDKKLVERVLDYLEQFYAGKISLKEISDELYVSMYHLSRVFKKVTGENFSDYLNEIRIKKAKGFLKNSKFKIYEIAYQVGFNNEKYFAKIFKRVEGITPSEYKKKFGL